MENIVEDGSGVDDSDVDGADEPAAPAAAAPTAAAPAAEAAPAAPASSGVELWSVDYDAAARLAFEAAGSSGDFAAFKATYCTLRRPRLWSQRRDSSKYERVQFISVNKDDDPGVFDFSNTRLCSCLGYGRTYITHASARNVGKGIIIMESK